MAKSKQICFCQTVNISFSLTRIFGIQPLRWFHDDKNKCRYQVSIVWLILSLFQNYAIVKHIITSLTLKLTDDIMPLQLFLINEALYSVLSMVLICFGTLRSRVMANSYNMLVDLFQSGVLCQSALIYLRRTQFVFSFCVIFSIVVQFGSFTWLYTSQDPDSVMTSENLFFKTVTNVPLIFYLQVSMICNNYIYVLGCFERILIKALNFRTIHPYREIEETNNFYDYFGLFRNKLCQGDHSQIPMFKALSGAELLDTYRRIHEQICIAFDEANSAVNPQLLIFMGIEMTSFVSNVYNVIMLQRYDDQTSDMKFVQSLSFIFVGVHVCTLVVFLRTATLLIQTVLTLDFLNYTNDFTSQRA